MLAIIPVDLYVHSHYNCLVICLMSSLSNKYNIYISAVGLPVIIWYELHVYDGTNHCG